VGSTRGARRFRVPRSKAATPVSRTVGESHRLARRRGAQVAARGSVERYFGLIRAREIAASSVHEIVFGFTATGGAAPVTAAELDRPAGRAQKYYARETITCTVLPVWSDTNVSGGIASCRSG
jgi:hypothetical protein